MGVVTTLGSKTLRSVFRWLLGLILHPGVNALASFCFFYTIAEYTFSSWYFAVGHIWEPAFPLSWRILFLLLFVVPSVSFTQLFFLFLRCPAFAHHCWRLRFNSLSSASEEYIPLPVLRNDSDSEESARSGPENDERLDNAVRHRNTGLRPPPSLWYLWFVFWLAVFCTSMWFSLHYRYSDDLRYLALIENADTHPRRNGYANQEKVFIAAMFSDNEHVIPYWSASLIKVIRYLGEDNVFVSILENGSSDSSPALLRQLDDELDSMRVARRILTEDTAIEKPADMAFVDLRVAFLSALRNRVLEPLVEKGGYDKVIFSNDIFIEPETVVELLKTADGEYDMACGLDFGYSGLYDVWVVRDRQGRLPSTMWPYFFDAADYEAVRSESPVPVFACWDGIVVFRADPVLPVHLRSNDTLSSDPLPYELPASHPAVGDPSLRGPNPALTPPLRFRTTAAGECFSSESFLFPYDLRRLFGLKRIFVNPRVIVGYEWKYYVYFKWFMRHPVVKWWIEKVYDGMRMYKDVVVIGDSSRVFSWDGGDCHPWQ